MTTEKHTEHHSSFQSYVTGFLFSIVLTIIPLVLVLNDMLENPLLLVIILLAACFQFVIQIYYFMHLRENKNRGYIVLALIVGIIIVVTVVGGSAWVMNF
ncbi:cytochrome C oxidase subunit IV family protein [Aquibacillus salsiterrae]|uniref:Cytochrome C oxidase subunit IV family protein n=1 Tax=Aquibacillus salsiterrae TaxID=2950439 RepID=A0A9X4AGN1_9BACI|nr:cytochrome C oxidase subunit IV family protein [Aquibacillus salsiterrae]MDC3417460.1 cytochrome C oxidase subunit IV family protein [Aquibacillus salsiterrae]